MRNVLAGGLLLICFSALTARGQELKVAHLGECPLESGRSIQDCQLGYRTFGQLNTTRSNVVVLPTWASGRSEQAVPIIGRLVDTSKYYVVVIDALANGVSSSPSNSRLQPKMKFPAITIHDMVVAEHLFLTKELRLDHVQAVMGLSMGGMQTFEWIVTYPDFMDKAIPIVGSTKLASYDLVLWQTEIDAIKNDPAWMEGNYTKNPAVLAETRLGVLTRTTPAAVNAQISHGEIPQQRISATGVMDANDHIRQAEAMIALDVSKATDGNMAEAAKRVKAQVFVIVSAQDHTVTPQPALDFAKMLNAKTLIFDSICGHEAPTCDLAKTSVAVNSFLGEH